MHALDRTISVNRKRDGAVDGSRVPARLVNAPLAPVAVNPTLHTFNVRAIARSKVAVAGALKPGARFVLEYPTVAEVLFFSFQENSVHEIGDIHYERNGRYDPSLGRIIVEHSFRRGSETERKVMSQRIYTYREVCGLLTDAGFTDIHAVGGLNDEPFKLGAKRLLLTATKR